jgi:hypothetical protein
MQPVPERRHVGCREHASAVRRCASGRRGQRPKTTARRASRSVSPGYYALTQVRALRPLGGILGTIHAAATTRSPRASGVHRGRAHRLPPGHPRTRHAGATTCSPRASGIHRGRAHRLPSGHPRTRHAGATTCSPRALVSIEDALTGCPRDILGPATRERRLVHLGRPVSIEDVLIGCPRDILGPATRVRRLIHLGGPVSIEDVLTGCPRDILGPATRVRRLVHRWSPRLPPFDPRGILRSIHPVAPTCAARAFGGRRGRCSRAASWTSSAPSTRLQRLIHLARPVPMTTCSPGTFGTAFGSSARLQRLIHLARRMPMTTCSPGTFGTAFGSSALVYRPYSSGHHGDALGLIHAASFASIGKVGTRSRRRRAR